MSASHPWMKFYPRDWRGDQALRIVSMAARGFWIECLSIMHEAQPYGHLVVNGNPVEDDVLARLVGTSVEEVRTLRDELIKSGVANQTRAGVLVSRRMVRDENRAKKGRKAIKKRWEQAPQNKGENGAPNRPPTPEPITQKPDTRSQIPEERIPPKSSVAGLPADVRAILEEGGYTQPPNDLGRLRSWYEAGASLEQDILPMVRRVRPTLTRPPFTLKVFEPAILEKVAADAAEVERWNRGARRIKAMDEAQAREAQQ